MLCQENATSGRRSAKRGSAITAAAPEPYPTSERVLYVNQCMRDHPGAFYEMVNKCSCAIDAMARDIITAAGFGDQFIHRTGHGIGLSVHEEPYIMLGNAIELAPGMAFSIEPGIYFGGEWGARIEDIVVVTADGCESMNNRPHGLTVL